MPIEIDLFLDFHDLRIAKLLSRFCECSYNDAFCLFEVISIVRDMDIMRARTQYSAAPYNVHAMFVTQDIKPRTSSSNSAGKKRGRKPQVVDAKERIEQSRQSARECRARKKLRYQYTEELVALREKAIFSLRQELATVCKNFGLLVLYSHQLTRLTGDTAVLAKYCSDFREHCQVPLWLFKTKFQGIRG